MGARPLRLAVGLTVLLGGLAPAVASAAITINPATDTVTTSRLSLAFGPAAGNVERLDSVRWTDSNGAQGPNLATNSGPGCGPGDPSDSWGRAGSVDGAPQPVGDGTTGTWTPRGRRTVEITSSRPVLCTGDSVVTPVRTRYTFFDAGGAANKVRVERRISFSAATPNYPTISMRAYVPEMPASYSQVIQPNLPGTGLVTDATSTGTHSFETSWNQTWIALNNPATNAGVLILRDPATPNPARIIIEDNGVADSSSVDLLKPVSGWTQPVTETEWLCFYDTGSWPVAQRSATNLPSQCSVVAVPINTAPPTVSGTVAVGSTMTATTGAWDGAATFTYQWQRCVGAVCTPIAGATALTYDITDADAGQQLRFDVTDTAPGGEADTASSALTDGVKPGPPQNTGLPVVTGEAREGETLSGTFGNWTGSPVVFQYQWERCATATGTGCADIAGATATTYVPVHLDVGSTLRLRVSTSNAQGPSKPAESAPTAVVQPLVIRAAYTITPDPSCTGLTTSLNALATKTPNPPIKRYLYTYKELPVGVILVAGITGSDTLIDNYLASQPTHVLYDGSAAATSVTFTWNRRTEKQEFNAPPNTLVRDPIVVTMTATDLAGASSTTGSLFSFAQTYANDPRSACPKPLGSIFSKYALASLVRRVSVTKTTASMTMRCVSPIACAGKVTVVPAPVKKRAHRAAARKPVVLASQPFFSIAAKHTATIKAKLTAAGKALVRKKGKPIAAIAQLTSISALGKSTTRSFKVTLPRHR